MQKKTTYRASWRAACTCYINTHVLAQCRERELCLRLVPKLTGELELSPRTSACSNLNPPGRRIPAGPSLAHADQRNARTDLRAAHQHPQAAATDYKFASRFRFRSRGATCASPDHLLPLQIIITARRNGRTHALCVCVCCVRVHCVCGVVRALGGRCTDGLGCPANPNRPAGPKR